MTENRTVTHHISQKGIYVYARKQGEKTELIILNMSNDEQYLPVQHYRELIAYVNTGQKHTCAINEELMKGMKLSARQSVVIELQVMPAV